jgi:hypothetical protein
MKVLYSIVVVLAITMFVYLLIFSFTNNELLYAQQQEQNQTDIQEINLTLGKPTYTEKFTVPKSIDEKLSSSVYSFSGNGTLNGMKITTTGNALMLPREDGTSSITDGRALFISENGGSASYSFEAIINMEDNVTKHRGAAFFDANATGNLEFLKNVVGVYKAVINEKGTFAMWQLE